MGDARHIDGGVTSAAEARLAESGLIGPLGPGALDVRTGVMAGPGSLALVVGTSATGTMTVQINPHVAVTTRGSANGVYLGPVLTATTTVNIAAAPGTGSRIDVVYVKQQDSTSGVPSPDVSTAPLYGVLTGTAGSTPAKPSLSTIVGAEELATVQVFAGAASTNSANVTITNTARQTVARGGVVPARTQAERDAISTFEGLTVGRSDTGQLESYLAGGWQVVGGKVVTGALTPASGYGSGPWGAPIYRRRGPVMALQGSLTNTGTSYAAAAGTEYQVGTLPAGTAPASKLAFSVAFGNGANFVAGIVTLHTDGTVWYIPGTAVTLSGANQLSLSLSGIDWVAGV